MQDSRPLLIASNFPAIRRDSLETVQVNLGYKCNLSCVHCHVNAGPTRTEMMSLDTIEELLSFLSLRSIKTLDLTGGAPEMNPHFRYLVERVTAMGIEVIDRCNLTILLEPGYEDLADFLATNRVTIVASLPCYLEENVEKQRGKGVYSSSIKALQKLNQLGYGHQPDKPLHLVYNPIGPVLPPPQQQLQEDYKKELSDRYGLVFNQLFTITNMPISRFGSLLISKGEFESYLDLLKDNYRDENLATVMCRNLISIDWQGFVYDCDFNQMLNMPMSAYGLVRPKVKDLMEFKFEKCSIVTAEHCYGCTAGQGSSCGGALNE